MNNRVQRRDESHRRIIEAAGRLFREHGVDGVGVDAIMREAGLTHGGFYAHFASKEALVAEVSRALLARGAARWTACSTDPDKVRGLRRIVEPYLSVAHTQAAIGCPLTTLSSEAGRRPTMRHAMDEPLQAMLAALERCLPRPAEAPSVLATMVGAVTLARLADDPALADRFLRTAADAVLPPSGAAASDPAMPNPSEPARTGPDMAVPSDLSPSAAPAPEVETTRQGAA
ncbi:TetR/AcrR family transcriptional regulator [Rhodopila sp.]|uniref:TetR/AcrR family transcriptional regulator n=1 Tax=Rhodopila sp. TaxID=2480087 RepID=UPI002C568D8D|nr:TetR/AcrR family transcriptional regulator [Rhodopila sp.]HVZ07160.1 TetR/AcrR family transcriptional regulator [Rhodopila sp.]